MADLSNMSDDELLALYQQEKARVTGKAPPKLAAGLQRSEDEDLAIIQTASGTSGMLDQTRERLNTGQLELGPVRNLVAQGQNLLGLSDPSSRNFASFRSNLEKLRNDSLRLNKGVQTEGDAQRAWNELFTNLNDENLVQQRLDEIDAINQRAIANRSAIIQNRRLSQNVAQANLKPFIQGMRDNPFDLTGGQSRNTIPRGAYYRDPQGNLRRNDNSDKGNPIIEYAPGRGPNKAKATTSGGNKRLVYNPATGELE